VHECSIRAQSSFFDAVLGKPWKDSKERTISLPDDEADIVKLYVHYAYRGQLCVKDHENRPEYFTLAKLYVFGEKVGDKDLKNAVIDCFIQRLHKQLPSGGRATPKTKVVDIIYSGTVAGSPARKLMVDIHAWDGDSRWITENADENNKAFLMDLS
ncbi:hypothetical protein EJ03DRAFT_249935, partial [Teratosphaeria nubilosa]